MTRLLLGSLVLAAAAAVLLACPEQQQDRRAELLTDITHGSLLVDMAEAVQRGEALHEAMTSFCASPDAARLDAAQDAWMQLRAPWKRLLAVQLGPIIEDGYESAIDFWPVRTNSIEGGVATGSTTQAELDTLGVASKGMPAIEYLLWDPINGDAAVLAAMTPARCTYTSLLAADVTLRLTELEATWRDGFADEFTGAAESSMYPTLAAALDELVNGLIAGLHDIDDMKLAKPLGLASGVGPDPTLVESHFSMRSLADARDGLAGFEAAYLGADAEHIGLTVLIAQKSPDIDADVREALERAKQALDAVPEPLTDAIVNDPELVSEAENAVEQLRVVMTADVASLLGVTVSLSDNDGD